MSAQAPRAGSIRIVADSDAAEAFKAAQESLQTLVRVFSNFVPDLKGPKRGIRNKVFSRKPTVNDFGKELEPLLAKDNGANAAGISKNLADLQNACPHAKTPQSGKYMRFNHLTPKEKEDLHKFLCCVHAYSISIRDKLVVPKFCESPKLGRCTPYQQLEAERQYEGAVLHWNAAANTGWSRTVTLRTWIEEVQTSLAK